MLRTLLTTLALTVPAHAAGGLNLAWEAEPRTVDPRFAVDANSQYLENLLHCALVDFDKDGRAVPDLAKSWKWLSPTSLAVELDPAARFGDGSKVTASDVKATYDSMKREDVKNPSPRKGAFAKLKQVTAKGEGELLFDLEEPDSTFALNLVVGILPAKTASTVDMLTPEMPVVGCGPFKLKSFASTAVELSRNESYGLDAAPKTATVTIKIVKDETTRYAKLQAGEVDIVQNAIGRDKLTDIAKKNPSLKVVRRPGLNTVYLGFNMKDPLVGKLAVRQAIAQAIDREKIIKYVLNGFAVPATTLITPTDPFLSKSLASPPLDLAKAKKLLDDAGFKDPDGDGKKPRFALTYKTTTDLTRIAVAKAIAADLRKVGIDVTVESLEWGRFKADVEAGKVQMWSLQWVGFKDPDIYRFAFATESFPPNGGNRGFYSNAELDKLLTLGRVENDPAKRADTYEKVQKIVSDEMPYVFLWHEEIFAVVNDAVEGFELFADGRFASLQHAYRK
jgi:peptide/nickel transport system substrate-binding protein